MLGITTLQITALVTLWALFRLKCAMWFGGLSLKGVSVVFAYTEYLNPAPFASRFVLMGVTYAVN